jgi:hypothetical protein
MQIEVERISKKMFTASRDSSPFRVSDTFRGTQLRYSGLV